MYLGQGLEADQSIGEDAKRGIMVRSPGVDVSWTSSVGRGVGRRAGKDSAWGSQGTLHQRSI